MMSLGVFLYKSIAKAYESYNLLTTRGLKVLEISPLGGEAQILVQLNENQFSAHNLEQENSISKSIYLENLNPFILETYLSLKISSVNQGLLVLESAFLGESFALAELALANNCELVDLRLFRGEKTKSVLFLTAPSLDLLKDFKIQQTQLTREIVLIEKPTEELKSLFA